MNINTAVENTMNKNYYVTFGSDREFPYPNKYLVINAPSRADAQGMFRQFFPDRHKNTLNYSFMYEEEEWQKIQSQAKHPIDCAGCIEFLSNGLVTIQTIDVYETKPYDKIKHSKEKDFAVEETIQVLKTMYPKTAKMVNGRLQGGFNDHNCKEGRALDGAIGVLEEMEKLVSDKQDSGFWNKVPDNGENSFAWNTIKRFHDGKVAVMAANKEQWKDFINIAERIEGINIPPEHRKFAPSFSCEQYGYMGKIRYMGKIQREYDALCREFYRSCFPSDMEFISVESFIRLANTLPLAPKPKETSVPGHMGTFKPIDEVEIKNNGGVMICYLMESVEYGQDANMVVINKDGQLVAQDITSKDIYNWKNIAADCLSCSNIYPISIEKDEEPDLD